MLNGLYIIFIVCDKQLHDDKESCCLVAITFLFEILIFIIIDKTMCFIIIYWLTWIFEYNFSGKREELLSHTAGTWRLW